MSLDTAESPDNAAPDGYEAFPIDDGFEGLVGPLYHSEQADGQWLFRALVEKKQTNPFGIAHGGFLSSFADHVVNGIAFHAMGRIPCATVSLHTDFVAPVEAGTWLLGQGEVVGQSKALVFLRARISADDEVVATVSAICKRLA